MGRPRRTAFRTFVVLFPPPRPEHAVHADRAPSFSAPRPVEFRTAGRRRCVAKISTTYRRGSTFRAMSASCSSVRTAAKSSARSDARRTHPIPDCERAVRARALASERRCPESSLFEAVSQGAARHRRVRDPPEPSAESGRPPGPAPDFARERASTPPESCRPARPRPTLAATRRYGGRDRRALPLFEPRRGRFASPPGTARKPCSSAWCRAPSAWRRGAAARPCLGRRSTVTREAHHRFRSRRRSSRHEFGDGLLARTRSAYRARRHRARSALSCASESAPAAGV